MMNRISAYFIFCCFLLVGFSSCQKESDVDNSISAQDHANIITATDVTINDATAAAGQVKGLAGKNEGGLQLLCGTSLIDTAGGRQITIAYDNTTACRGMVRGGSISISVISGPFWRDAYAQLQVVFNNFTITNSVTGASYSLSGTYTVTNETGGLAWLILAGLDQNTSVSHRVQASNLHIVFPNGTQRVWNVDRTIKYSSAAGNGSNVISVYVSSENKGHEESWGTNRNGDNFTSYLVNDMASNNNVNCSGKPYQGEYSQSVGGQSVDILYGVDANGNPLNNPADCAYGYKITYTKGKKILTQLVAYIF